MLRYATETIASTLTIGNHRAVANTIGAGTTTAGSAGHSGVAKWIVFGSLVFLAFFSHNHRLQFSFLATFQVIGTDNFKAFIELPS